MTQTVETPDFLEVRRVIKATGLTGSEISRRLRLGKQGDRTVRRWQQDPSEKGASQIPFAAYAWLKKIAGESSSYDLGMRKHDDVLVDGKAAKP